MCVKKKIVFFDSSTLFSCTKIAEVMHFLNILLPPQIALSMRNDLGEIAPLYDRAIVHFPSTIFGWTSYENLFLTLPLAGPFLYIVQITFIWSNMYQKSWTIILGSLQDLSDTTTRPLRHQNHFLMTSHTTSARKTMVFSSVHVIHKKNAYQRLQNTQKRTFFT